MAGRAKTYDDSAEPALAAIRALLCSDENEENLKRVAVTAVAIASQPSHARSHQHLTQALSSQRVSRQPTPHKRAPRGTRGGGGAGPASTVGSSATQQASSATTPAPGSEQAGEQVHQSPETATMTLGQAIQHAAAYWQLSEHDKLHVKDGKVSLTTREWHDLFQDVHKICVGSEAPDLYADVEATLAAAATIIRVDLLSSSEANLLDRYRAAFNKYHDSVTYINLACKFLNDNLRRQQLAKKPHSLGVRYDVDNLGMKMWRENVYNALKQTLIKEAFQQVLNARRGLPTSEHTLADVLQSMLDMCSDMNQHTSVYVRDFETPFLDETYLQFVTDSRDFLSEHGPRDYLQWAGSRLDAELLRSKVVLRPFSQPKLLETCARALVRDHMEILTAHAKAMLEEEQQEDLQRLYDLLSRTGDVSMLTTCFKDHVAATGADEMAALRQAGNMTAPQYFEAMRALHQRFLRLTEAVFSGDALFLGVLDRACSRVANFDRVKAPEFLAKVCDQTLKRSSKSAASEDDLDRRLKSIMTIFSFIEDKDVFQKFYSRHLARRLIQHTFISEEAEQDMIGQLKAMCGFDYTSKLQRMFTDVTVSANLESEFKVATTNSGTPLPVHMHVLVLQTGAWPLSTTPDSTLRLPPSLAACAQRFEDFYQQKHTGRKLTWLHSYSTAELKARLARVYEFTATAYQMAVLLHFNSGAELRVCWLQEATQLNATDFARTMSSLVAAHVVKATRDGQSFTTPEADDVVKLNTRYNNKRHRVRIAAAYQKETASTERKQTRRAIDGDRHLFLKATGVRVMKTRKMLHYNDLVQEIIGLSKNRFKPPIPAIKKCIEEMIDEQYIRRDAKDRALLAYIA